jgi:uncharacterized protein
MALRRSVRYQWLKFLRLQDDPRKVAWGMALGVFIGFTPTVPFHTAMAVSLALFFRVSLLAAYVGIWVMNPVTMAPLYIAAYKVGQFLLYKGRPLVFPETYNFNALVHLLCRGGLALQVGGLIIAIPPAIIAYFLTLWAMQRYRREKARKAALVLRYSQSPPAASGPEA